MGEAVKLRETTEYVEEQAPRNAAAKAKRDAEKQAKDGLKGKVFADLNGPEKDDLLKALAIQAGIIEE